MKTLTVALPGREYDILIERGLLSRINRAIVCGGVELYCVSRKENKRLEDVFIEMTGGEGGVQID